MERRYLAATIAMAATFALFSHAFGSGLLNRVHDPRPTLVSEMRCAADTLRSHLLEKVNHALGGGSGNAEEAQLRVEFNLPAPMMAAVPAPPAAPIAPAAPVKAAAPHIACPSQRLSAERISHAVEREQARVMAMQSKIIAKEAKWESKAFETQAKLMAVQAKLTSEKMQREMRRAALEQMRASMAQTRSNSHSCSGERAVHVITSRSDDGDVEVNVDTDQLSRQVEEQVSRTLRSTMRNF